MSKLFKNLFCMLLSFALIAAFGVAPASAVINGSDLVGATTVNDRNLTVTEAPTVNAKYGILCAEDGTVLWSRDCDTQSAMASITKVMTAVVALENANLDDKFTVTADAAAVGESTANLTVGSQVSVYDLLCGLLVHSGNDAGVVLAEGVAGSIDAFVDLMNEKAQELGLENTHYTNPHGLDEEGHYSSAYDICVLSRYAMKNPTFRKIVRKKKVTLDYGSGKQTFKSTNSLLNTWGPCKGIKTGYTGDAGYCLTSMAKKDGVTLYAVVLGCQDEAERFTDSYKILDWGFSHYRSIQLAAKGQDLVDAAVSAYTDRTVPCGVEQDTSAMVLDYDGDISIDVSLMDLPDGVAKGDRVGTITWRQGENVIDSKPLVANEDVGEPFAIISVWTAVCRVVGWFTGDDCVADSVLRTETIDVTRTDDLSGEDIDKDLEASIRSDALSGA